MEEETIRIRSKKEMKVWAEGFAAGLRAGDLVSLKGELGAGKTQLVQWIGAYFQVEGAVYSPTFSLVNVYPSSIGPIRHVDLYRLRQEEEIEELDYEDFLYPEDGLTFIEWADRAASYMPPMLELEIEKGEGEERFITLHRPEVEE